MAAKPVGCDFCKYLNYVDSDDFYVYEVGRSRCKPLYSYEHFVKNKIILHFVVKGKGILRLNNKQYDVHERQIFFIPENTKAFYQADKDNPWEYMWIHIGGPRISHILKDAGITIDSPVFTPVAHFSELENLMMDTLKHYKRQFYCVGNVYKLCDYIIRNSPATSEKDYSKALLYVKNVISYIQLKYSEPIKIDSIAAALDLNRSYLSRLFKDATGYSLQEYLITYRMKMAVKFLEDESLSINEIGYMVGYNDTFTFSKAFKRHYGSSPSEYRKTH